MKTMTEPAPDKQLDELSKRVDFGFDQTSQRLGLVEDDLRALRTETKAGFDRVHDDSRRANGEIVGFRGDVSDEFTVVRREVSGESTALRAEMKAGFDRVDNEFTAVRAEMKAGFEKVDREFVAVRAEMKAGFDGLQRQMTRFFAGTLGTIIAGVIASAVLSHL